MQRNMSPRPNCLGKSLMEMILLHCLLTTDCILSTWILNVASFFLFLCSWSFVLDSLASKEVIAEVDGEKGYGRVKYDGSYLYLLIILKNWTSASLFSAYILLSGVRSTGWQSKVLIGYIPMDPTGLNRFFFLLLYGAYISEANTNFIKF